MQLLEPFIFILVLDSVGNEKQRICVLLATVKSEHGLVPLKFRDFSLETAVIWMWLPDLPTLQGKSGIQNSPSFCQIFRNSLILSSHWNLLCIQHYQMLGKMVWYGGKSPSPRSAINHVQSLDFFSLWISVLSSVQWGDGSGCIMKLFQLDKKPCFLFWTSLCLLGNKRNPYNQKLIRK